jgi:hypothetical protein
MDDSIDTYRSPKAEPVTPGYSPPRYTPPDSGGSIDTYGTPKAEPVTSGYLPPPVSGGGIDTYGSPKAEPLTPSTYSAPKNPDTYLPQPQYSAPASTTTPCPPKKGGSHQHQDTAGQGFEDFSGFPAIKFHSG